MEHRTTQRGTGSGTEPGKRSPAPPSARRCGRYVLLDRIGSGGMGVVYAAYDPEVDRKVAVKLLWPGSSTVRTARMAREARTMARLSHPNVVQVFDVGVTDEQVWMAMELVEGPSLHAWLAEQVRPWQQVLDVIGRAGRGLAAAHRSGIVHRDFKPSNVLLQVDRDTVTRVLVTDFGVARATGDPSASSSEQPSATASTAGDLSLQHRNLTMTGGLVGTPAYMAPEQHDGRAADERADQYALCVTLFEGLYGERPFDGSNAAEIAAQKLAHEIAPPPGDSSAPRRLHGVLVRGLAPDPDARWPSVEALLDVLERATRRKRSGTWLVLAMAGAGGTGAWVWYGHNDRDAQRCSGGAALVEPMWNPGRIEELSGAFEATALPYATDTWQRVHDRMDAYLRRWVDAHELVCESSTREGETTVIMDRQMQCLRRGLTRVDALLRTFDETDAATVENAVEAVSKLPPPSPCLDVDAPRENAAAPADADAVDALRTRLAQTEALDDAGRYAEGRALAATLVQQADALGYTPVVAEAYLALGRLESRAGQPARAEEHLAHAAWTAAGAGSERVAAHAAIELAHLLVRTRHAIEEASTWTRHAEAAIDRLGDPPRLRAELLQATASVRQSDGDYAAAREQLERARAIAVDLELDETALAELDRALGDVAAEDGHWDEAFALHDRALEAYRRNLGPKHPKVAFALNTLGVVATQKGEYDRARAYQTEALALREELLGEDHPDVAGTLTNLGALCYRTGKHDEARRHYERALAIKEKAFGKDHLQVVTALQNLAAVETSTEQLDVAERHLARAAAIVEATNGPDDRLLAAILGNLGVVWARRGRYDRAAQLYERTLAIEREALGDDHPDVAITRFNLGRALLHLGRPEDAAPHYEHALAAFVANRTPGHVNIAQARMGLGQVALARRRFSEAIEWLEQARVELDRNGHRLLAAEIDFELARALVGAKTQRERAITLARSARAVFEASDDTDMHQEVTTWLNEHERL